MIALSLAGIALISLLAQWLAWSVRVPAILFLLLSGLLLGPVTGLLDPDQLLGDLLFPLVSLSVAIILFEGALTLHLTELKGIGKVVRNLCSTGMVTSFAVIGAASYFLLGLDWRVAMVLGAVLVVTGPTVIAPMLNVIRPVREVDKILRWEGIVIDPIGALFAVLVFEAVRLGSQGDLVGHTLLALAKTVGVGSLIGVGAGWLTTLLIRKDWLPVSLHKFGVLALVLVTFTLSDWLSHESGLLAVTVFGIWLANQEGLDLEEVLAFKEDLAVILISSLFILLAARLDLAQLWQLGPMVLALLCVVQFVARPLCILVSTRGSDLPWRARALLAWIAPRGIVAAAVSASFAISMHEAGIEDADKLVPLVFAVIIFTVVLQSLTATPLARLLDMRQSAPNVWLLIGANSVARAIGKALADQGIPVQLSDPAWEHCKLARMSGLPCYFGNPQSEHAERHLPPHQHQHRAGALSQPPQQRPRGTALRPPLRGGEGPLPTFQRTARQGQPGERHLPCPPEPVRRRHQLRQAERPAESGRADQGDPPERHLRLGPVSGGQSRRHSSVRAGCQGQTQGGHRPCHAAARGAADRPATAP